MSTIEGNVTYQINNLLITACLVCPVKYENPVIQHAFTACMVYTKKPQFNMQTLCQQAFSISLLSWEK